MRAFTILAVGALCAFTMTADDARLAGPASGFVFHGPSRAIRPILGVPGAAYLGPSTVEGFENASVSPQGTFALATAGGGLYLLRGFGSSQPEALPIGNAIPGIGRFAWSGDGASAALYSPDSRQAQVVRNLVSTPTVDDPVDLSAVEGAISAFVFDGKRIVVGAAGLYVADPSGPVRLMREIDPAAIAIGGGDLYVADQGRNQVWIIRDYSGAATPMLFADERSGVSSPAALRVSRNGAQLLIANGRGIDALDIATRAAVKHIELDFTPSRMEAIGAGRLALLNGGDAGEPLYLMDTGEDLMVYFIPDGREQ
jgi:hypothetical protein